MKNGEYQYDLVQRLSFLRFGGTEDELKAAHILLDEIEQLGGQGELMDFTIPAADVLECSAEVTAPFSRAVACAPFTLGGDFPEGVELKLYYAARGVAEDYVGITELSDSCVILDSLSYDNYKLLCEKKAAAFITVNGKWYDSDKSHDLIPRALRPKHLEYGKIPGFAMRACDVIDMIRDGAQTIRLRSRLTERETTSRNVLATIPGTACPEESIVVTAHYDSVLVGTGSWDNATGAATLMYLYHHFLTHPPRRTLRFIWCGSEEQGLYGSKAYVEQNEELLKEIKFCFNYDMCGTVLGHNKVCVTGSDELKTFAQQFCHEVGVSADVFKRVHSSDSAPFCDKGIPALGISRGGQSAEIHTRNDLMFPLSAKGLAITADLASAMMERVVNAVILPVKTGMPDDVKEELDKYFQRDKK